MKNKTLPALSLVSQRSFEISKQIGRYLSKYESTLTIPRQKWTKMDKNEKGRRE